MEGGGCWAKAGSCEGAGTGPQSHTFQGCPLPVVQSLLWNQNSTFLQEMSCLSKGQNCFPHAPVASSPLAGLGGWSERRAHGEGRARKAPCQPRGAVGDLHSSHLCSVCFPESMEFLPRPRGGPGWRQSLWAEHIRVSTVITFLQSVGPDGDGHVISCPSVWPEADWSGSVDQPGHRM